MNNDDGFRMMELGMQGFNCSQILMLMAMEAQKQENPNLIRAMTGLVAGMGCGKVCGALTGGCCLLGLYAGKSSSEENAGDALPEMLSRFVEWFESEYTPRYGGTNCSEILQDDARNKMTRCSNIVLESFEKLKEILAENGYDLATPVRSA